MAKHSKYEDAERELIEAQMEKLKAILDEEIEWPKKIPYTDVGSKWHRLTTGISMDIIDFSEKWNIPPMEED